jgi:hypothetical protein
MQQASRTGNLSAINTNGCTRTNGGWHAICQIVVPDKQQLELRQDTQLGWNGAR